MSTEHISCAKNSTLNSRGTEGSGLSKSAGLNLLATGTHLEPRRKGETYAEGEAGSL